MPAPIERRYAIGEVSRMTGVPDYVLRQWEAKFPQLKPLRTRANRRYYLDGDIDIVRRIKTLVKYDKFTRDGARVRLAQELHGEGRPRTRQETIDLIDRIETEIRALIDLLDAQR